MVKENKDSREFVEKAYKSKESHKGLSKESIEYMRNNNKDEIKVPDVDDLKKLKKTDLLEARKKLKDTLEKGLSNVSQELDNMNLFNRHKTLNQLSEMDRDFKEIIQKMRKLHQTVDFKPRWAEDPKRAIKYIVQEKVFPKAEDGTRPILNNTAEGRVAINQKEKLSHELKLEVRSLLYVAEKDKGAVENAIERLEKEKLGNYPAIYEVSVGADTRGLETPNGDKHIVDKSRKIYAVLDGEGHGKAAHDASETAKNHIEGRLSEFTDDMSIEEVKNKMKEILLGANQAVLDANLPTSTTVAMVKIMKDGTVVIGHGGDSRVYLLEEGGDTLEHLTLDNAKPETKDDLLVQDNQKKIGNLALFEDPPTDLKAAVKSMNVVDNVLGTADFKPVISVYYQLKSGSKFVITSDGVHDNLPDPDMAKILKENPDTQIAAETLVKGAKEESRRNNLGSGQKKVSLQGLFANPVSPSDVSPSSSDRVNKSVKTDGKKPKPDDITAIVLEIKPRTNTELNGNNGDKENGGYNENTTLEITEEVK